MLQRSGVLLLNGEHALSMIVRRGHNSSTGFLMVMLCCMLYRLSTAYDTNALELSESYEQALAVMTKGEYVNKLHDIFHGQPRCLEAFVKSGVVNWPFNTKKVKANSFKICLWPCDACVIAKTTRAIFRGKIMTDVTIGSVWQTDICGK